MFRLVFIRVPQVVGNSLIAAAIESERGVDGEEKHVSREGAKRAKEFKGKQDNSSVWPSLLRVFARNQSGWQFISPPLRLTEPKPIMKRFAVVALRTVLAAVHAKDWVEYEGKSGPGNGKHIVFLSGDEEYRSEEALRSSRRFFRSGWIQMHGALRVNPDGVIAPTNTTSSPHPEALDSATRS